MVMPLADISGEEKKAVKPIPISNKSPQAKGSRCEGGEGGRVEEKNSSGDVL